MKRTLSERAVILAPRGRDANIAATLMQDARIESVIAGSIADLVRLLRDGAGFALVTDEALKRSDLRSVAEFIREQEEWSDFPFILLTQRGGSIERNPAAARHLELLGNVTFLERPFHPTTLVSLAQTALRGRRRQYDARARLQTIRDSEEQLRIALAAGRLGAWSLDIATMALRASAHCKANFGRAADASFSYEDLISSVHPDDREAMQAAVGRSLETGADYDIEYRCIWPDGSLHWVLVRGRPEYHRYGQPARMVGVSQDISERKTSEEALRSFAAELEERVEQRTREREMVSAQLHEAQKLETLGQLTGGVAHDFNNLLTPIVGTLDLLRRRTDDPRSQKMLEGALKSSERARILIARLLAFARRQNLEIRPINIKELVGEMSDLIQRSIGPTISLEITIAECPSTALADPNQLELALLNLAVNARDAMPDGGRLAISTQARTLGKGEHNLAPGPYVLIQVQDSGKGMDPETLARAVEPFYSTKGVGKGTGLGLSMVHGLAAQSGGALVLESSPGKGTTAKLWLPAAMPEAIDAPVPLEGRQISKRELKILLVDDQELVRQSTGEMLSDLGHQVVEAPSGGDALGILRAEAFDIVITDYLMPAMSGVELAREARRIRADLPVLMITGFADLVHDRALDIARLAKPFQLNELAQAIEDELFRHTGGGRLRRDGRA